jgi:hypothetical protein
VLVLPVLPEFPVPELPRPPPLPVFPRTPFPVLPVFPVFPTPVLPVFPVTPLSAFPVPGLPRPGLPRPGFPMLALLMPVVVPAPLVPVFAPWVPVPVLPEVLPLEPTVVPLMLVIVLFEIPFERITIEVVDDRAPAVNDVGVTPAAGKPPNGLPGALAPWCVFASAVPAVATAMQTPPIAAAVLRNTVRAHDLGVSKLCLPMTRLPQRKVRPTQGYPGSLCPISIGRIAFT